MEQKLNMRDVHIVVDSTADLPLAVRQSFGIHMVPLHVYFGDEEFEDQVTIDATTFYQKLAEESVMPKTSQPSPARFLQVFNQIFTMNPQATIVSLLISSGLSGTYQSALLAKSMLEDEWQDRVHIIDTKSVSIGYNVAVIALAEALQAGLSLEDALISAQHVMQHQKLYFVLDTLTYLHKNGRIGGAAAFVGSLLQVKPILSISAEGIVYSIDKARGRSRAIGRIVDLLQESYVNRPVYIEIAHANVREQAEHVAAQLRDKLNVVQIQFTKLGPVIGTHSGPGALAVVAYER
jgi:DegV family protein with EDD domain